MTTAFAGRRMMANIRFSNVQEYEKKGSILTCRERYYLPQNLTGLTHGKSYTT